MLSLFLALSLVLLILAGVLRARRTRRSVRVVRQELADVDPARRLLVLEQIERDGVGLHAKALYRAALVEQHPVVLEAMVGVVRRALWEPAQSPDVVALRRWAGRVPVGTAPAGPIASNPAPGEPDLVAEIEQILGERLVQFRMGSGDVVVEPVRPARLGGDELPSMHSPIWWLAQRAGR